MTGELPKDSKPKGESAPPTSGDKPEKTAPAPEAGTKQEHKPRGAETRLTELLDDLKRAGLTPAELKTFKREAKAAEAAVPAKAAPEQTENPAELKAPVKPKLDDFKGDDAWQKYEDARDKYYEDLADYKATQKIQEFRQDQQKQAAQQGVRQKMEEARTRYSNDPEAVTTISSTARAITGDQQIPQVVKVLLNDSPVWPDLLYVMGSKAEELASFVEQAHADPGGAIRKIVLLERLVTDELAKGKPAASESGAAERDESGKFKAQAPAKKEPREAPPPARELSGKGTAPPDAVDSAVKNNDFRRFREQQNAKELAARRG